MTDCLFCKIATGEIPGDFVIETDRVVAFRDIDPKAPTHILVIPRTHFSDVSELALVDPALTAEVISVAAQVAKLEGLSDGHRIVTNTGVNGGQSVAHVHFHVLGGRSMTWPPG
jgi:histidine triad (HIT) family protein